MTPEQQLEKLLHELSELTRYVIPGDPNSTIVLEGSQEGGIVLWQDIEAILKQTFPDDEFH